MLVEKEKNYWTKRAKRTSYTLINQIAFDNAQKYADAATFWSVGQITEKIVFSILFGQYKQLLSLVNHEEE